MLTQIEILEKLKAIVENAVEDIKLEKGNENNGSYELVKPVVNIGYVPPKNIAFEGYTIPGITLYIKEGEETGEILDNIDVLIGIQTYDPGTTTEQGINFTTEGYKDILNIISRIRTRLNNLSETDKLLIKKPFKWGLFDEQLYPYWSGYINLKIDIMKIRKLDIEEYL